MTSERIMKALAELEKALALTQELVDNPDQNPKRAAADLAAHSLLKANVEILRKLQSGDIESVKTALKADGIELNKQNKL